MKRRSSVSPEVVLRALRSRNYRLFFAGQFISLIGTWMQIIAMSWLVYRLTRSAFLLGAIGFAGDIFAFLLMPFAGVFADRYNRHKIIVATQSLAMIQALILAALVLTHSIQIWQLFVLAAFLGAVNAFDMPTRQAFVIQMIENKEDLPNAIALNSSIFNGARLFGPAIAGLVIAVTGEGYCFLLNGISYIAVIIALLAMRLEKDEARLQYKNSLQELTEGFAYAFGFLPIRNIILMLAVVSLMGMSYSVLMPIIASELLHGDPRTLGFLVGASGMGALIAALYFASRRTVLGLGRMIPIAASVAGSGLIILSLSRNFYFSLLIMLIIGFGFMTQMTSSNTLIQTIVDDDKRGRVMGIYSMAFKGITPFGSLLAGILASKIGSLNTLIISGVSVIAGAVVFARKLPALRKLVRPIYVRDGIIPGYDIEPVPEVTLPLDTGK